MYTSIYDFKSFYNDDFGKIVQRILNERIRDMWPDLHDLSLMGTGYAIPYLNAFEAEAASVFALMPAGQGAHHWPNESSNRVALAEQAELPIETNSLDRVLMIHDLEFSEFLKPALQEIWRVLKSDGRVIVVVPNRAGLWARVDWSPFGEGTPYSVKQLNYHLRGNLFVHERTEEALFVPPFRFKPILKTAEFWERAGRKTLPIVAGVHIVEFSKQLYAPANKGSRAHVQMRGRGMLTPNPAARIKKD